MRVTVTTTLFLQRASWAEPVDYDVEATGNVVELSSTELATSLDVVEGLPPWLSLADLEPEDQERLVIALEEEFERRLLIQKDLPRRLNAVVADLQRSLGDGVPADPHERIGWLTEAIRITTRTLESIVQEAA